MACASAGGPLDPTSLGNRADSMSGIGVPRPASTTALAGHTYVAQDTESPRRVGTAAQRTGATTQASHVAEDVEGPRSASVVPPASPADVVLDVEDSRTANSIPQTDHTEAAEDSGGHDSASPSAHSSDGSASNEEADDSVNAWAEYEDVLTDWEKRVLDIVDRAARALCAKLCSRCSETTKNDATDRADERFDSIVGASSEQSSPRVLSSASSTVVDQPSSVIRFTSLRQFAWWEGMRDDVPERYQRWEGIRERNAILGLLFGLAGYKRKQPTLLERANLFFLYAAVWYLCFSVVLIKRGLACRKSWVDVCVPFDLGGGCTAECASASILARTPPEFRDYGQVSRGSRFHIPVERASCVASGAIASPCEIGMCVEKGEAPCLRKEDGTTGFCNCEADRVMFFVFEMMVYTVIIKLIHMPYWYIFVRDLEAVNSCVQVVVTGSVVPLGILIIVIAATILWKTMYTIYGCVWQTLYWLVAFVILCCFEVVKSFCLGYLAGTYVVRPLCPMFSRVWKFLLA